MFGEITGFYRAVGLGALVGAAAVGGTVAYYTWDDLQANWINTFDALSLKTNARVVTYDGKIEELAAELERLLLTIDATWS